MALTFGRSWPRPQPELRNSAMPELGMSSRRRSTFVPAKMSSWGKSLGVFEFSAAEPKQTIARIRTAARPGARARFFVPRVGICDPELILFPAASLQLDALDALRSIQES